MNWDSRPGAPSPSSATPRRITVSVSERTHRRLLALLRVRESMDALITRLLDDRIDVELGP